MYLMTNIVKLIGNISIYKKKQEVKILHNKARFIEEMCQDTLDLRNKTKDTVKQLLTDHQYDAIDPDYKYLTKMSFDSFMEENITELRKKRDQKKLDLNILNITTIEKMWLSELKVLLRHYNKLN